MQRFRIDPEDSNLGRVERGHNLLHFSTVDSIIWKRDPCSSVASTYDAQSFQYGLGHVVEDLT